MPTPSNGAELPPLSGTCALHDARISAIEGQIGGLVSAVQEVSAKIDDLDIEGGLRGVLADSASWQGSGYAAVVEAVRSTAALAIGRGADVASSKTGAILALCLLVSISAASGLALRSDWVTLEAVAEAVAADNMEMDTSPPEAADE